MNKFFGHLNTVLTHKRYVCHYCFLCGLYYQGIVHDLSKFSPIEFFESVKYYNGKTSPINICKETNEYSMAWFHHRGRNKHHWEYWYDRFERGGHACKIPWKYVLEMICDFLGAGVAYSGGIDNFDMANEYKWWQEKRELAKLHPDTLKAIDILMDTMYINGVEPTLTNRKWLNKLGRAYTRRKALVPKYDKV